MPKLFPGSLRTSSDILIETITKSGKIYETQSHFWSQIWHDPRQTDTISTISRYAMTKWSSGIESSGVFLPGLVVQLFLVRGLVVEIWRQRAWWRMLSANGKFVWAPSEMASIIIHVKFYVWSIGDTLIGYFRDLSTVTEALTVAVAFSRTFPKPKRKVSNWSYVLCDISKTIGS